MLPNLGFGELAIILVLALLLFGAKRLPEVARGIGKSFNAFKKGLKEVESGTEEIKSDIQAEPKADHQEKEKEKEKVS